jgi:hypothetical protein
VAQDGTGLQAANLDYPGKRVRERQEQQGRAPRDLEHLGERALDRVACVGEQVEVGDLAALGAAGGARGVDDRGQVRRRASGPALPELLVGDIARVQGQAVRVVDHPEVVQGGDRADQVRVRAGLGERGPGPGVGQDPVDLLGRGGLVDRDRDRAGGPDRVVDQGPFVPRARHQRDPVAGLDARGHEALGQGRHLVAELPGGDVVPAAVSAGRRLAHDHRARVLAGAREDHIGEASRGRDIHEGGNAVLAHDASLMIRFCPDPHATYSALAPVPISAPDKICLGYWHAGACGQRRARQG